MSLNAAQVAAAWEVGRLEWKLDSNQEGMYQALKRDWDKSKKKVLNCSRQLGKSYFLCLIAIEKALQHPGRSIKYAAETQKQVRAIVRPHFRDILADCPAHLRPVFHTQDGEFRFPNGSVITVAGCETEEKAEKLLGQHAHEVFVDEAGSIAILEYVLKTILLPQTLNTNGKVIICSTPAKTPGHYFKELCEEAEAEEVLIQRTIYDNPRITERAIAEAMKDCGGEDSTEFQREYLVRHVTDTEKAIIKGATERRLRDITLKLDENFPTSYRPTYFDVYEGMDVGWSPDFTGWLIGYWHYETATLVIEDEILVRQMDTKMLAAAVKAKEELHYGHNPNIFQRWSDIDGRLHADLANDHGIVFLPTPKDDLDSAINRLNLMVLGHKYNLRIHPRCKDLLRQLKNGVWNKQKTKFAHTKRDGHYDLVAALIYLARNVAYEQVPSQMQYRMAPPNVLTVRHQEEESRMVTAFKSFLGLE